MKEFSLEFLIVRNSLFISGGVEWLFFPTAETRFFRQSERFYFCCHKRLIIIAIWPYTQV